MKPQPFIGDLGGPDDVIDKADDGTPLTDNNGWTCWYCERMYATVSEAEAGCTRPPNVRLDFIVGSR